MFKTHVQSSTTAGGKYFVDNVSTPCATPVIVGAQLESKGEAKTE